MSNPADDTFERIAEHRRLGDVLGDNAELQDALEKRNTSGPSEVHLDRRSRQ